MALSVLSVKPKHNNFMKLRMKQSKHGIKECEDMTDLLLAFLVGFAMGDGLLAIMLKSICREDRKDENDET